MQQTQAIALPPPMRAGSGFTITGTFTAGSRTVAHRQYLSKQYVVTQFEGSTALYRTDLDGRFAVDSVAGALRPMKALWSQSQSDHLRAVLGQMRIERDDRPCEIDGYQCGRHLLWNEGGRITIVAEAWCARLGGLEETALRHEREFESSAHPFVLALEPDELVVRSIMRTSANGTEQRQIYRLLAVDHHIAEPERFESYLRFPIVGCR